MMTKKKCKHPGVFFSLVVFTLLTICLYTLGRDARSWTFQILSPLRGRYNVNVYSSGKVPDIRVGAVDCSRVFDGDRSEIERAEVYQKTHRFVQTPAVAFVNMTSDCKRFKVARGYITTPLSREEAEFPLAYSIVLYRDVAMAERLLRAIYQPQNYYCIMVDESAHSNVKQAMGAISDCFDNVFIASKKLDIEWGT